MYTSSVISLGSVPGSWSTARASHVEDVESINRCLLRLVAAGSESRYPIALTRLDTSMVPLLMFFYQDYRNVGTPRERIV